VNCEEVKCTPNYSEKLELFLESKNMWHRFIEFGEPVRTVEQAARKVRVEKIAKSIVMVDSNGDSLLAIVPAQSKVSHKKIKIVLAVKDVRLASPEEVLKHSGYPAGGVSPFNNISRVLLDPQVLKNETAIVGGGDIHKLIEVRTEDIVNTLKPRIEDITQALFMEGTSKSADAADLPSNTHRLAPNEVGVREESEEKLRRTQSET
jgi:prolyl-tRNA editing enzyme YbaK/EbsC (Cys-tRNA(Pro) deacylase)